MWRAIETRPCRPADADPNAGWLCYIQARRDCRRFGSYEPSRMRGSTGHQLYTLCLQREHTPSAMSTMTSIHFLTHVPVLFSRIRHHRAWLSSSEIRLTVYHMDTFQEHPYGSTIEAFPRSRLVSRDASPHRGGSRFPSRVVEEASAPHGLALAFSVLDSPRHGTKITGELSTMIAPRGNRLL